MCVPAESSATSLQSNDTGQPFSTGAPVVSVAQSPMSLKRSSPSTPSMPAKRSAILRCWGLRILTQKKPAWPIGSCAEAVLLTQTRSCGGSAETEQTAVAVNPPRCWRWRVVIRVTLAARWRMPFLKAAASMLMI